MAKSANKTRIAKSEARAPEASAQNVRSNTFGSVSDARLKGLICLLLVVITLVAYWQVFGCKFIESYDDQDYVTSNTFVGGGINLGSIKWAFTTFCCSNWHPVTWLSHMADCRMYGLNPLGHHLTNLLFHIANALLLFLVLSRMTGAVWRSAFVAALFAVHPVHVESVAWVAERKDLLSTFFWFVTIYAYLLYAQRPCVGRYVPVVVAFGLGLMCKPMLVSLPLVLLLLDYWPLNRMNLRWRLVWEKAPLFAMSVASCIITVVAQRSGGAVDTLSNFTFRARVGNAAVSYVGYIAKMMWPSRLAVFYPLDGRLPAIEAISAIILLVVVSVLALWYGRQRRYFAVGWLWYLITLVPVIGLVQVGSQALADRYSYVTLTGLFVIFAWGIPDLLTKAALRRLLVPSAVVLVAILAVCTWTQVRYWHDSYTLFDHAVKVTKDNCLAYNNRGTALVRQGRREDAIADFTKAVEIQPTYAEAQNNLGVVLIESGQANEGIDHLLAVTRLGIKSPQLRLRIALAYCSLGKLDLAMEQCGIALRLDPKFAPAHNLLGTLLGSRGRLDECISHLKSAAAIAPNYPDPHGNLALAYRAKRDYAAAWKEIHIFKGLGGQPRPEFVSDLAKRMPDPGP